MKKNFKAMALVLGPAIAVSFFFSVNLTVQAASRTPAEKVEKLSYLQAMKKGIELSVSK